MADNTKADRVRKANNQRVSKKKRSMKDTSISATLRRLLPGQLSSDLFKDVTDKLRRVNEEAFKK